MTIRISPMNTGSRIVAILLVSLLAAMRAEAATITVQAGTGFNDPTVVAPVGGNTGVTLGQQRTNLFNFAAARWGERLQSNVPIVVSAQFSDFADNLCSANSGTLGRASATAVVSNFPSAPPGGRFYVIALANAISGSDQNGNSAEITADFNADVDTRSDCLGGRGFYYGFDNDAGSKIDLLNTVMHEFAHGFGFASLVDAATGVNNGGSTFSIYDSFLFDETTTLTWPQMTNAQRQASAINNGNLTWNGPIVTGGVPALSAGTANGRVRMFAPSTVQAGSSISHWDTAATPNLLMEPVLSSSLRGATRVDFTTCLLRDIGWTVVSPYGCPDNRVDVAQTQTDGPDPAPVGSAITYLFTTTNNGEDLAHNITLADTFSGAALSINSVTPSQGSCTKQASSFSCSLGVLANGASATVTALVTPNGGGTIMSAATVTSAETETSTTNNLATVTTTVTGGAANAPPTAVNDSYTVVGNSAATVLAVRANDTDPDAGQTLSVTAVGTPSPADSATVAVASGGTGVSFAPATGFVGAVSFTYNLSDGNGGTASATVTVNVTAPPSTGGSSGGGGSIPMSVLLALLGMTTLRRRTGFRRNRAALSQPE